MFFHKMKMIVAAPAIWFIKIGLYLLFVKKNEEIESKIIPRHMSDSLNRNSFLDLRPGLGCYMRAFFMT